MKIYEVIGEMTTAGGIATTNGGLGGGDPKASIYASKKPKKKKKTKMGYSAEVGNLSYNTPVKTPMIKR
jgi:hypothetical protein|tara:strand:- start:350 stop:556 length:207 start_codon:yes stop_codon:yes gene_type:complete